MSRRRCGSASLRALAVTAHERERSGLGSSCCDEKHSSSLISFIGSRRRCAAAAAAAHRLPLRAATVARGSTIGRDGTDAEDDAALCGLTENTAARLELPRKFPDVINSRGRRVSDGVIDFPRLLDEKFMR